ncbi:hypothetical protein NYZ99_20180 [Maribacter litopenaei]|uniref:SPOR domain-containing protein n=1 Tax=Maribacter litopenaei TaxID=2976127 RepID=A0ABY5Y7K1_9FLAO|nr:hypothetical protein [Maribacter litopenaei]UWX54997.1 hypothetical protein NYZ99_20180 [Maribacter litopenaei]
MTDLEGFSNGYYIIAGVFSKSNKLDKQVKKLTKKGFDAGYIQNPENKLYYLYLNHYGSWQRAISDCKTNFDGNYNDAVWILNMVIENSFDNSLVASKKTFLENNTQQKGANKDILVRPLEPEDVTYDMIQEQAAASNLLDEEDLQLKPGSKAIENDPNKSMLIKRADAYFDKMWYAEAAKLYEMALDNKKGNYSYEVLQKIADAYYFNTNMEQAYKWYNTMFETYGEQMSADNIFRYAHSLKGTGNYARSKRLMRLYNKKYAAQIGNSDITTEQREQILDRLLNTKDKFDIKNLNINSEYSEFSPVFLEEDKIVFASAKDSSVFSTETV